MATAVTPRVKGEKITPEWVRRKRLKLGLSQRSLAERIGTSRATVNRWERGIFHPHPVFQRMLREL